MTISLRTSIGGREVTVVLAGRCSVAVVWVNDSRAMTRSSRRDRRARTTELEQVGVESVLERGRESVPRAFVDLELRLLDDLRGLERGSGDRHDLIVVTVDDQRRNVDLLQVLGQIGLREDLDAVVHGFEAGLHAAQPERVEHS